MPNPRGVPCLGDAASKMTIGAVLSRRVSSHATALA